MGLMVDSSQWTDGANLSFELLLVTPCLPKVNIYDSCRSFYMPDALPCQPTNSVKAPPLAHVLTVIFHENLSKPAVPLTLFLH